MNTNKPMAFFQRSQSMGRRSERRARTHPLERLGASLHRQVTLAISVGNSPGYQQRILYIQDYPLVT